MTETATTSRRPRVYISFSHKDASAAALIARALQQDLEVELGASSLISGSNIASAIGDAIESSDAVVVLLSRAALESWIEHEATEALDQELKRRDIDLVPVLLEPCEIPRSLRHRLAVDLSDDGAMGVGRLVTRLIMDRAIDFQALDHATFERLVFDLLQLEHFELTADKRGRDASYDFMGSYNGERWIVEVKHQSQQRMSVSMIHRVVGIMGRFDPPVNALLVTSSQLTSVAREFLDEMADGLPAQVMVIDGIDLKQRLAKYPDLIDRFFTAERPKRG